MSGHGIKQLTREWERLRLRYGVAESPPEIDRLLRSTGRRRVRIRHLQGQLAETTAEIALLEIETNGLDKALGLVLGEAIHDLRSGRAEAWSPVPVLGFRIWKFHTGGFYGYREHWKQPSLRAYCPSTRTHSEVPHTDGRCGETPCGIYAAKDVRSLLDAHGHYDMTDIAVGLVGMSGKVVEHEKGYRAEYVSVLAMALAKDNLLHMTDEPQDIALLFQGVEPPSAVGPRGMPTDPRPKTAAHFRRHAVGFMQDRFEKESEWILESPNG